MVEHSNLENVPNSLKFKLPLTNQSELEELEVKLGGSEDFQDLVIYFLYWSIIFACNKFHI